jgi:hypothetical protein
MSAPHTLQMFDRDGFLEWLEVNGASISEPTNEYEVVRYKRWTVENTKRPATHIIYRRGNGTLTYTGRSRADYEEFSA